MKQFLPVVWWLTATLVIAFVLVGLGYLFADALLLGVLFLPGMLTARYFVPQLSFENRRQGILDTVYLALAILGIEYLSLMLGHAVVLGAGEGGMPGLLLNPPFILLVLTALIAPEIALEKHLERRCPYARSISFVSDRRKITLDPAEISYVESNDSEVWIHTAGGLAYRTKTRISQWETQLDSRFLRHPPLVHRQHGAHRPLLPGTRGDRRNDHRDFAQIPGGRAPTAHRAGRKRLISAHSRRHAADRRESVAQIVCHLAGRTPHRGVDPLLGLGRQTGAPGRMQFVPVGPFQFPARSFRKIVGVQRLAQRPHDPSRHARLLFDLTRSALLDALPALQMPFGQVPAAVAVDHQPLAAVVHHHAARRLDRRELRSKGRESPVGIVRNDGHGVVRFEKIQYLGP